MKERELRGRRLSGEAVVGLLSIVAVAASASGQTLPSSEPGKPSVVPAAGTDPGDDKNIPARTAESERESKLSLFGVDRPLGDASRRLKARVLAATGIEYAVESTTLYQFAPALGGADDAAVHTLGLFATWTLYKADNGVDGIGLGFSADTRQNFRGDDFRDLQAEVGAVWSPNDATSGAYAQVGELWLGQQVAEGKFFYLVGKVDPGAYLGGNRLAGSGNTQFFSQPLAGNPARAFPDNGLGAVARLSPVEVAHVQVAVTDSDAVSDHSPFTTLDGRWFYVGEVALKPRLAGLGQGTYRLNAYHRDLEGDQAQGWALSFDQELGVAFGVFARYGGNDGAATDLRHVASAGVSFVAPFGRTDDEAGVGMTWARPTDRSLSDECSAEGYYRLQLTDLVELSGSAQLILTPSAGDDDVVGVLGLRVRVLF